VLSVGANATFSSHVVINNRMTINSSLTVNDYVTIVNGLDVHDQVNITSKLNVDDHTSIRSTLYVDGTAELASNLTVDNTISEGGVLLENKYGSKSLLEYSTITGLLTGGRLGINLGNPLLFDVSGGTGQILDVSDPENLTLTQVSWSNETAISVDDLATTTCTNVFIDVSGNVVQEGGEELTPEDTRDKIYLGKLYHFDNTQINGIDNMPITVLNGDFTDFVHKISNMVKVSGGIVSANGSNLKINISQTEIFKQGSNYFTNPKNPNIKTISATSPTTIQLLTQTTVTNKNQTDIQPGFYDVGGTKTAITSNKYSNQYVYICPFGFVGVQFGTVLYNKLSDAVEGVKTENHIPHTGVDLSALLICVISVSENATDLSDNSKVAFTYTNEFGNVIGGTVATNPLLKTLQETYENGTGNIVLDGTNHFQIDASDSSLGLEVSGVDGHVGIHKSASSTYELDVSGTVNISEKLIIGSRLEVNNNITIASNMDVTGTITEGGTILSSKYASISHNHDGTYFDLTGDTVTGTSTFNSTVIIKNNVTINSDLVIDGSITEDGTPLLFKYASVSHNHDSYYFNVIGDTVTGVATFNSTLIVKNDATINSDLVVDGSISEGGTSLISKYASISHNHDSDYFNITGDTVTGASTFNNKVTILSNLDVSGNIDTSSNLIVDGTISEGGTALSSKYADINHNHDSEYLTLTGGTITGYLTIRSNLQVDGTTILGANVYATSYTENGTALSSKYALASHNHDSDYFNITGDTVTGSSTFNNNVTVKSTLVIEGDLGVNTTDPSNSLHIVPTGSIGLDTFNVADAGVLVGSTSNGIGIDADEITKSGSTMYIANATHDIQIHTNSATQMYIGSDGNIGIGRASTGTKLDVSGTVNIEQTTTLNSDLVVDGSISEGGTALSSKYAPIVHNHDDRYYTETEIDNNIYTKTQSDAKYALLTHNHDGTYFDLTGDTVTGASTFQGIIYTEPTSSEKIRLSSDISTTDNWLTSYDESGNRLWILNMSDRSENDEFAIYSENTGVNEMRISIDGSFGLGGAPATEKLKLYGNMNTTGNAQIDGVVTIGSTLTINNNVTIQSSLYINETAGLKLVGSDHVYMEFYPEGFGNGRKGYIGYEGASANYLTIHNDHTGNTDIHMDGNVGIGNTAPSYHLDVSGNINFTGNLYQNDVLFESFTGGDVANATTILNNMTIRSNLHVDGTSSLNGVTEIGGATTVFNNMTIRSNLHVDGTSSLNGVTEIGGTTTILNNMTIRSNLHVDGTSSLNGVTEIGGATTVFNNMTIRSNLHIDGTSSLNGVTEIGGATTVFNNMTIRSNLQVDGNSTFSSSIYVDGRVMTGFMPSDRFMLGNHDWSEYISMLSATLPVYNETKQGMKCTGPTYFIVDCRVPVEPSRTYKCRVTLSQAVANGVLYIGADSLDNNFNSLATDTQNSYNYFVTGYTVLVSGNDYTFEGFIEGYNPVSPTGGSDNKFDPEAKYFNLLFLCNYGSSSTAEMTIKSIDIERIDVITETKNGNVGIGTTSPSYQLELSTDSAAKLTTTTWSTTSDRRIKDNIVDADVDRCMKIFNGIRLKHYTWKYYNDKETNGDNSQLGWIAQDCEEYFPKAIKYNKFERYDEDAYNKYLNSLSEEDRNKLSKDELEKIKEKYLIVRLDDCMHINFDQLYKVHWGATASLTQKQNTMQEEINVLKEQNTLLQNTVDNMQKLLTTLQNEIELLKNN